MGRLIFILAVSFGSLLLGRLTRSALLASGAVTEPGITRGSTLLKFASIFVLNPIPIVNALWTLTIPSVSVLALPFLGAAALLLGGAAAILAIRVLRIPPKRAGAVFTCGMFTNLGSLGALVAFVLYGEPGYSLVQLYMMLEVFVYYAIGFPLSARIAGDAPEAPLRGRLGLKGRGAALVPLASMLIGAALNVARVPRPEAFGTLSAVLVPVITGLLTFSIGLTLRISRVSRYRSELLVISAIKFLVVPAAIIPIGILLGLGEVMGGMPLRTLTVLTFMPVAFLALVPPALYGFDLDLANSGWLVTTFAMAAVIPVLFITIG